MAGSFAEAVAGPTPQPPPEPEAPTPAAVQGTDEPLVDPRSGEIIDLHNAPGEQLVDVVIECRRREGLMTTWRRACEDELRRRMGDRRVAVYGPHEVQQDTGRGREWDGVMLRDVVTGLIDDGTITASDVVGLVTTDVKVDGRAAMRLLDRLDGERRAMVEDCFHWTQKRRPKLTVAPVPDLADALPAGDA